MCDTELLSQFLQSQEVKLTASERSASLRKINYIILVF